jgi:hypothetical protein
MKKRFLNALVLIVLLLNACNLLSPAASETVRGSGNVITEERTVNGVTGVVLATLGDLTIELGVQDALRIEAEENVLPYLVTEVGNSNGVLTIRETQGADLKPTLPVRYFLMVKSINSLAATSSGNIQAPALEAGTFRVEVSSSGNISIEEIQADRLEVELSSSGGLEIAGGEVGEQDVTVSSSGSYEAGELRSESARVENNSSGSATVWVTGSLNANLSSSGKIQYYGNPQVTEKYTSSGRAESLGEK